MIGRWWWWLTMVGGVIMLDWKGFRLFKKKQINSRDDV